VEVEINFRLLVLQCQVILEGGGSNRTIGVDRMKLGNIGNLTADSAQVNYAGGGIGTENPGSSLPMIDSGGDPTNGGDTVWRTSSLVSILSGPGGNGKKIFFFRMMIPASVHSGSSIRKTRTLGRVPRVAYDFVEFIAGYSTSFQQYFVVFAKAIWTVRVVGNNVSGNWINTASAITLQGSASHPLAFSTR
jgi:hypothetical protein